MQTPKNTDENYTKQKERFSWADFLYSRKCKMILEADPRMHQLRLQYRARHEIAAACCVVCCCVRQGTKVGFWNTRTLDHIHELGQAYYKRCIRLLCLPPGSHIGIEALMSTFFIGDYKFTIKLEETSRGNKSDTDILHSSFRDALSTAQNSIITVGERSFSVWSSDGVYLYVPSADLPACVFRYDNVDDLIDDFIVNILESSNKRRKFSIVKLSIIHKTLLDRHQKYTFGLKYIKQHCDELSSLIDGVLIRKKIPDGKFTIENDDGSRIKENLPHFQSVKNNKSEMASIKHHNEAESFGEDFKYFTKMDNKGNLILIGTSNLNSDRYTDSSGFQGMHITLNALKMLKSKKAKYWDAHIVDDCLDKGYNDYMAYCNTVLVSGQRPSIRDIVDAGKITGSKSRISSIGWGRINDVLGLLEDLFESESTGILQIPDKLEMAVWKEDSCYYLFQPCSHNNYNQEEITGPARLLCFPTRINLVDYLKCINQELIVADFAIYKVQFLDDSDEDETFPISDSEWTMCGSQPNNLKNTPITLHGIANYIAIVVLVFDHSVPVATWTPDFIDKIVSCGRRLYERSMEIHQNQLNKSNLALLESIPPRFSISNEEFAEIQVFQVIKGHLFDNEKSEGVSSLLEGITNFFKEYRQGIINVRSRSLAIWKSTDDYIYCIDCGYDWNEDNDVKFCVGRFPNESSVADRIEEDLPPSSKNRFVISAVNISLVKLLPDTKIFPIMLQKDFTWIVPNEEAVLYGGKCISMGRGEGLPAAILFSCACRLTPPMRFTVHHLNCIADETPKFSKNLYSELANTDSDKFGNVMLKKNVNFGVHVFSIEMEQAMVIQLLEKDEKDEKTVPALQMFHDMVDKLENGLRNVFVKRRVQSLIVSFIGDNRPTAVWRASPFGPYAAFMCLPQNDIITACRGRRRSSSIIFPNEASLLAAKQKDMKEQNRIDCLILFPTLHHLSLYLIKILSQKQKLDEVNISAIRMSMQPPKYGLTNIFHQEKYDHGNEKSIGKHFRTVAQGVWTLTGKMPSSMKNETREALTGLVSQYLNRSTLWDEHALSEITQMAQHLNITRNPCEDIFQYNDNEVKGKVLENQIIGDSKATYENNDVFNLSKGLNKFFGELNWDCGLLKSRGHTFGIWKLDSAENPNNQCDFKADNTTANQIFNAKFIESEAPNLHTDQHSSSVEKKVKKKKGNVSFIDEYFIHISDGDFIEKIDDDETDMKENSINKKGKKTKRKKKER